MTVSGCSCLSVISCVFAFTYIGHSQDTHRTLNVHSLYEHSMNTHRTLTGHSYIHTTRTHNSTPIYTYYGHTHRRSIDAPQEHHRTPKVSTICYLLGPFLRAICKNFRLSAQCLCGLRAFLHLFSFIYEKKLARK